MRQVFLWPRDNETDPVCAVTSGCLAKLIRVLHVEADEGRLRGRGEDQTV